MLVSSTFMLLYSPCRWDLLRLDSGFQAQNARFLPGCDMRTHRICSFLTHACSVIDCVKHLIVLEHLCHTAAWTIFVKWTTVRALESCLAIVAAIAGDVRLVNCVESMYVFIRLVNQQQIQLSLVRLERTSAEFTMILQKTPGEQSKQLATLR